MILFWYWEMMMKGGHKRVNLEVNLEHVDAVTLE